MLFLAEGWAEPVVTEEPAFLVPLSETKPSPARAATLSAANAKPAPQNLSREKRLRFIDSLTVAADGKRRKRRRKSPNR
jgi:hypothetical protein